MELHQLRYFLAVTRTHNFCRAADQCHVAQPSLSQQIMKLEDELGERLFERTKREVRLTAAGELLREHAERVLEEVELARDKVREVRGLVRGRVALGALPTVAPYFLPPRLREFSRRHPGIEIEVHEDTTAQLAAAVLAKEIDVAVVSLPIERAGLVAEELFTEDLLVALPRRHALATRRELQVDDLEKETFILLKEGHCLAGQALQFCRLSGFSPQVSFRTAQIETILCFVAAGWGISIVPRMACAGRARGIVYRPVAGLTRPIGVIHREGRPLTHAARALVAFFRERLEETPAGRSTRAIEPRTAGRRERPARAR
ncbi:LysR substrate-binding domain-containing protein [Opitutus sp. ER46]|uniref:LysR family transcriptional regulator n=1 Tax=Opitutus sp. ER46 TaxID=2161864 RepID=UPI000D310CCE|nr:LysR substrate-binding domain-containing protein [Opitutus sp. ER46]PTX91605.1 LysR family transcriptional regulator [Opitutus sp. ER46]